MVLTNEWGVGGRRGQQLNIACTGNGKYLFLRTRNLMLSILHDVVERLKWNQIIGIQSVA